ncbi:hypothetical protein GCM10022393_11480 [Aquimarina addita]|uniref:TonB-dependent receptor plug domain-containing protein n=1 Tax=Aquimarina addita TaxID=870485 RepID=A0ABP7XDN9_9FLAO
MIKTKILVFLILFSYSVFQVHGQTEKDVLPLIFVLQKIQKKFGHNFSYVDNELSEETIPDLPNVKTLGEAIDHLKEYTSFTYTFLEEKTIAISTVNKVLEICGIIKNHDNKNISNASIQSNSQKTISNQQGEFKLALNSPDDTISIDYLGYVSITMSAKDFNTSNCKKIKLKPQVEYLNEVILPSYLIKGIHKLRNGSIKIDYTNFGILPGLTEPDVLQTLQSLPGIVSVNETVSDLNVRGGTNDQNLMMWDGIKIYQSSHFFGLISAFNPYLTKDVQLVKNGSSSEYGDGVSSVIAMRTDDKVNKNTYGSIGVNLISADGYIDTAIGEKSSLQLAVRHSINDLIETPTYSQYFDRAFQNSEVINGSNSDERFSFYDTSIRWIYQLSAKDFIKVNGILMRNNLVFQENSQVDQTNVSRESKVSQSNTSGGITYQRKWNSAFLSDVLLYGTNYRLEAINSDIENNQRLLQENDVLENGLKVKTSYKIQPNTIFKNGYQFNETGISNLRDVNNPTFRDRTKEVIRTHGLYSEIEHTSKNDQNHLNVGVRLNYFEKFNIYSWEPRISFQKRFANHFSLELLGEIKSQTTSQIIDLQNDFLGIESRRWILSNNDDIPVIKSQQASMGLSYNHANWLISSDFYYKNVDGIITRSQGFQNQYEFSNDHGSYTVTGIDLLINRSFKNFSTWLSYSFANNDYEFNNLPERNFPNNVDIKHQINLVASYSLGNFKLSCGINWHSGKPTTLPDFDEAITNNNEINYQKPNSSRLDNYIRTDISTTYEFKVHEKIKAFIGISAWNILDQENIYNQYYRIMDENTIEEISQPGLRTTPNIVFRLNF